MLEIGSSLREARRLRNVDLADVEKATRIRVQQLEALEQERFDQLPPERCVAQVRRYWKPIPKISGLHAQKFHRSRFLIA